MQKFLQNAMPDYHSTSWGKREDKMEKRYGENTLNERKKLFGGYFAGKIWGFIRMYL